MKPFYKAALGAATLAAATLVSAPAQANETFVIDFKTHPLYGADGAAGERGVEDLTTLNFALMGNLTDLFIEFSASKTGSDPGYAYFDSGNAGLGVCGVINSGNQCTPSSDDNLTSGEELTLTFYADAGKTMAQLVTIDAIEFRAANHSVVNDPTKEFGLDGTDYKMVGFTQATPQSSFTFSYSDGQFEQQYYISSITATTIVPEPASWLMMIVGFAGLGLTYRRRRTIVPSIV